MSARTLEQPLEHCGCGEAPCIHITKKGDRRLFQISCTRCQVATIWSDDYNEVISAWNDGEVSGPQSEVGSQSGSQKAEGGSPTAALRPPASGPGAAGKVFNPVLG